jgi:hypothetical protein
MCIPPGAHALTPGWLTAVLHERGVIENAVVKGISFEKLDDKGVTTQLARLHLSFEGDDENAPQSMIAKFSSTDPARLEAVRALRLYEREVRFYDDLAQTINLRTPRCYYSAYNPQTLKHILLLEDLAPARSGSMIDGGSLADAERVVREIAKLHIPWWENPQLEQHDWLRVPWLQDRYQTNYKKNWTGYVERAGDLLSEEMRSVVEKLRHQYLPVTNPLDDPPLTIIHRDLQLENLFFDVDGQPGSLAVIDWQWVTVGRGPLDLAWFLAANIEPHDRQAHEMDLLHMYHQLLMDGGIRGYPFEQLLEDYRRGVLNTFAVRVVSIGGGVHDARLDRMRSTVIPRMIAAVEDLNCGDLLA